MLKRGLCFALVLLVVLGAAFNTLAEPENEVQAGGPDLGAREEEAHEEVNTVTDAMNEKDSQEGESIKFTEPPAENTNDVSDNDSGKDNIHDLTGGGQQSEKPNNSNDNSPSTPSGAGDSTNNTNNTNNQNENTATGDKTPTVVITANKASIPVREVAAPSQDAEGGEEAGGAAEADVVDLTAAGEAEQEPFDLTTYATAVDENGNSVAVEVHDDGGFDIYTIGAYTVVFKATHPVTKEEFFKECQLSVRTQAYIDAEIRVADSSSNERYRKYESYKKIVQKDLQREIDKINDSFLERVELILSAFPEVNIEDVQFLRATYAEQDDEESAQAVMEYVEMDELVSNNWSQVLPVFVASSSMKVNEPLDLYNLRKLKLSGIADVFFDMYTWSYNINEDGVLQLILNELSSEDMIELYGMDDKTVNKLDELMQPEFQQLFAAFTGDDTFVEISDETLALVRNSLPEGLSVAREQVVTTAYSLVGKVKYFWGGKYYSLGWNPMWGVDKIVASPGSETFGSIRPYGLDCSGFVTWAFINAAQDTGAVNAIGSGSTTQWNNSRSLGWDEAVPGDLAFKAVPGRTKTNHVGIVAEKRADGSYLIVHCSSSKNGVVVTEAWESGFRYMRRPLLYEE